MSRIIEQLRANSTVIQELPPRYCSIEVARTYLGSLSKWTVFDLLRKGVIRAKKAGASTLVEVASMDEYLDGLPAATYTPLPPKASAAK